MGWLTKYAVIVYEDKGKHYISYLFGPFNTAAEATQWSKNYLYSNVRELCKYEE